MAIQNLEKLSELMPNMYLFYKNIDSVYLDGNQATANVLGFKNRLSLAGKTDYELQCKASELADQFQKQDQQVIQSEQTLQFLTIGEFADNWSICLTSKSPLYDESSDLIGIFGYSQRIKGSLTKIILNAIEIGKMNKESQLSLIISNEYSSLIDPLIKLTSRQSECLFYILRGKTYKQIANLLNLSPRTIEDYVYILRDKFNCQNKSDLISIAIEHGFMNYIPKKYLEEF